MIFNGVHCWLQLIVKGPSIPPVLTKKPLVLATCWRYSNAGPKNRRASPSEEAFDQEEWRMLGGDPWPVR